ncbi:MAG: divalent-cation tolerance protein CutA [Candidatus Jordarchaeales archaeon]
MVVFVTAKEDDAEKIALEIINKRLAACVNIVPSVASVYWWQGKIERDKESLLIIKSDEKVLEKLVDAVKKTHSYSLPEIIAMKVVGGSKEYIKWVEETLSNENGDR